MCRHGQGLRRFTIYTDEGGHDVADEKSDDADAHNDEECGIGQGFGHLRLQLHHELEIADVALKHFREIAGLFARTDGCDVEFVKIVRILGHGIGGRAATTDVFTNAAERGLKLDVGRALDQQIPHAQHC